MIRLKKILKSLDYKTNTSLSRLRVKDIKCDSRLVNKDDLFVAVEGTEYDGHDFINDAIQKGASALITSDSQRINNNITWITVPDTRKALAILAKNYYENPSEKIKVIGITGTNGKTTVSYLLESILTATGQKVGGIGTINYRIGKRIIESINTTPSSLLLNQLLKDMVAQSLDYAIMEVSSHSLVQNRTDEILFDVAILTNISPEHLDYHKNFKEYVNAKKRLFSSLKRNSVAVLNVDDPQFKNIRQAVSSKKILSFGIENKADIMASNIKVDMKGSKFTINTTHGSIPIKTNLIGRHNISNILAATAAAILEGINLDSIKKGVEGLRQVPGRLQPVRSKRGFWVFVDYAHTDDALKKVLEALKQVKKNRLIVVFGCGGQRDHLKRPRMGQVASQLADYVIITSDNPRKENPKSIAQEIKRGIKKDFKNYEIILDRYEAIARAISLAKYGDIVLIAGKGHEQYQVIGDTKVSFSDEKAIKEILKRT